MLVGYKVPKINLRIQSGSDNRGWLVVYYTKLSTRIYYNPLFSQTDIKRKIFFLVFVLVDHLSTDRFL